MEENEKHLKEIASLKQAAARSRKWADKNEATKIGYDPVKSMTARCNESIYRCQDKKDAEPCDTV